MTYLAYNCDTEQPVFPWNCILALFLASASRPHNEGLWRDNISEDQELWSKAYSWCEDGLGQNSRRELMDVMPWHFIFHLVALIINRKIWLKNRALTSRSFTCRMATGLVSIRNIVWSGGKWLGLHCFCCCKASFYMGMRKGINVIIEPQNGHSLRGRHQRQIYGKRCRQVWWTCSILHP
jgi:hypothetical protein